MIKRKTIREKAKITELPFSIGLPRITLKRRFRAMGFKDDAIKVFKKFDIPPGFVGEMMRTMNSKLEYLKDVITVEKDFGEGKVVAHLHKDGKMIIAIHDTLLGPAIDEVTQRWSWKKP